MPCYLFVWFCVVNLRLVGRSTPKPPCCASHLFRAVGHGLCASLITLGHRDGTSKSVRWQTCSTGDDRCVICEVLAILVTCHFVYLVFRLSEHLLSRPALRRMESPGLPDQRWVWNDFAGFRSSLIASVSCFLPHHSKRLHGWLAVSANGLQKSTANAQFC